MQNRLKALKNSIKHDLQHCLPHHALSRLAGYLAECRIVWLKNLLIRCFINYYHIDISTAKSPYIADYPNFNAFFTRELKTELRPIDEHSQNISSPVDGRVSQFGKIQHTSLIQAKGISYNLPNLLQDEHSYKPFIDGHFITLYLSPRDYHRVHMPIDGKLYRADYIPGSLFSVNQFAVNHIDQLFSRNERLICYFQSTTQAMAGDFILIMVGAMLVAGIETVWSKTQQNQLAEQPLTFSKGEEIGHFKFGSTVIMLFSRQNAITWQKKIQIEQPLCFGETLACVNC